MIKYLANIIKQRPKTVLATTGLVTLLAGATIASKPELNEKERTCNYLAKRIKFSNKIINSTKSDLETLKADTSRESNILRRTLLKMQQDEHVALKNFEYRMTNNGCYDY